jgi:mono/diheme cytochrome c family protein
LKPFLVASVAYCFVLALTAASAQSAPSDTKLPEDPVFQKNCAKCHGKTAQGRHFGGPSLGSEKVATASADDLRNIISKGKGRMPKFTGKLTSEEIDRLVREISALNKK